MQVGKLAAVDRPASSEVGIRGHAWQRLPTARCPPRGCLGSGRPQSQSIQYGSAPAPAAHAQPRPFRRDSHARTNAPQRRHRHPEERLRRLTNICTLNPPIVILPPRHQQRAQRPASSPVTPGSGRGARKGTVASPVISVPRRGPKLASAEILMRRPDSDAAAARTRAALGRTLSPVSLVMPCLCWCWCCASSRLAAPKGERRHSPSAYRRRQSRRLCGRGSIGKKKKRQHLLSTTCYTRALPSSTLSGASLRAVTHQGFTGDASLRVRLSQPPQDLLFLDFPRGVLGTFQIRNSGETRSTSKRLEPFHSNHRSYIIIPKQTCSAGRSRPSRSHQPPLSPRPPERSSLFPVHPRCLLSARFTVPCPS